MKHFAITSLLLIFCTFLIAQKYSTHPFYLNDVSPKYIIEDWAKEEAKRDFQNTVQAKAKFYDLNTVNPKNSLVSNTARPMDTMDLMDIDNNKPSVEGFSVQDTHIELSDGRFVPKYERYYGNDFDHESLERNSKNTAKQMKRGVQKFYRKAISTISKSIPKSGRH